MDYRDYSAIPDDYGMRFVVSACLECERIYSEPFPVTRCPSCNAPVSLLPTDPAELEQFRHRIERITGPTLETALVRHRAQL